MSSIERACKFLKDAETYYLATVEGDQPRVRPFGTANIFEGKLYIQTHFVEHLSPFKNNFSLSALHCLQAEPI